LRQTAGYSDEEQTEIVVPMPRAPYIFGVSTNSDRSAAKRRKKQQPNAPTDQPRSGARMQPAAQAVGKKLRPISREAAQECSPLRKPWVGSSDRSAAKRRKNAAHGASRG